MMLSVIAMQHGHEPAAAVADRFMHERIRDKHDRLPSELAGLYGRDPVPARLLRKKKDVQQARAQRLELRRRPDRTKGKDDATRDKPARRRRRDSHTERDRKR